MNVAALIKKVRTNRFGEAAAPPPMKAPKNDPPRPQRRLKLLKRPRRNPEIQKSKARMTKEC